MKMLLAYQNPHARHAILARFPELGQALDLVAAFLRVQDAELYDAPARQKATEVCRACLKVVGALQETHRPHLTIAEELALCRLKQAFRDAVLTLPWPYNRDGDVVIVRQTMRGQEALDRLLAYDALAGPASYRGSLTTDLGMLVAGTYFDRKE